MTFHNCLDIAKSFLYGKPHLPPWLRAAVLRIVFLVGSTTFLLFARIKVMGAKLPVFTK